MEVVQNAAYMPADPKEFFFCRLGVGGSRVSGLLLHLRYIGL